ncbi:MAG TPA: hypothetical protein VEA99_15375 [Gemmatimonadaceae bacterium]|nr:hypothetical protein [Gemmatimonadaceae bacterium]
MRNWLPITHLVLTVLLVGWNVVLASRIAQMRKAPRPFAAITALAGFLLVPALLLTLAASSAITGRALTWLPVQLLWPLAAILVAIQAIYALVRGLVYPLLGVPIAVYDVLVAAVICLRFAAAHGVDLPPLTLFLLAADSDALALTAGMSALTSPFFFLPPLISPAFPALRPATALVRGGIAFLASLWALLVMVALPRGARAVRSYGTYAQSRLTERAEDDFRIGVKLFPDLARPPAALALRNDLAVASMIDARVVMVTIVPDAATAPVLDSVARSIEGLRRDTTLLVVSLGYRGRLLPLPREQSFDEETRLRAVERVVRRLQPDILLPADEPYASGTAAFGYLPPDRWASYFTRASAVAKRLRPRTRVGLAASTYGVRDSSLYAWAAAPGSPIDIVGFSFFPSHQGAGALDAALRAADRWMRSERSSKPHWVFAAYGYPVAHGEESQERAVWGVLAWATARPNIRGVIVHTAADYGTLTGLRAPSGRLRSAAYGVLRGVRALRAATTTPTDSVRLRGVIPVGGADTARRGEP